MTNNPLHDPVYKAIVSICELKGSASYAEIATISGIKKQKALDYILRNKHLLRLNKTGKILGFISHEQNVRRVVEGLFSFGKVYKTHEINYGADRAISVRENHFNDKLKSLVQPYYCGGIGDSYKIECILLTDANKKVMEEIGFRDFDEVVKEKLANGENSVWSDWCVP
jgi:hypothetical protein